MKEELNDLNGGDSISKDKLRAVKLTFLLLLISFPVIYLIYKTKELPERAENKSISVQQIQDISSLEASVKINPTVENLINLSMAYINKQMPGKSIDYLKRAIALSPDNSVAYNNLGVAYIMLQQYQEGLNACSKALQIDSSFQLAKNNLKWANDEKNKVIADIKTLEQMPVSKRNIEYYSALGLNYFKIGDYGKSIEIWNKIVELDPENAGALNSIGTAFMMKGQIDDAVILYKKALELEPNNQLAKNNLAWALDEKSKIK